MAAGVFFAFGCLIFAFTSVPGVHWMGSAVGAAIIISESDVKCLQQSGKGAGDC
jgi:hypothetical protein